MNGDGINQVILGSGQLGQAIARELARRGTPARMVNSRGQTPPGLPQGIQVLAADLYQPDEVRRVTQDAALVYHTVQPPYAQWVEKFPPLHASIIEGLTGSSARLVMGDNLYMYGPVDGLIHEGLPYAATTRKGSVRARMAEALLTAHAQNKIRVTIGRGSDFFGPGVTSSIVGESLFGPLAKGKAANVLGNPDLPHTYTFINDFGKALVILGEHEEAFGQVWHVPNAETINTRQFVTLAAEAFGVQPKMMVAGPLLMRVASLFVPEVREMIELEYEVTKPYVVDDRKFKNAFGDCSTPLKESIALTAAYYKQRK